MRSTWKFTLLFHILCFCYKFLVKKVKGTTSLAFKLSIFISGLLLPVKASSGLGLSPLTLTILVFLPLQTSCNLLSVWVHFKAGLLVSISPIVSYYFQRCFRRIALVRDDRTRNTVSELSRTSHRNVNKYLQ